MTPGKITIRDILLKLQEIARLKQAVQQTQPQSQAASGPVESVRALRQNTIDQTAYTPQAIEHINQVPINFFGTYNSSTNQDNAGGGAVGMSVGINRKSATPRVLRHELLHTMDDNTYLNSDRGGSLGNSMGFVPLLGRIEPQENYAIGQLMQRSGLYNPNNQDSQNVEKFAYFGQYPSVMLAAQELAQKYSQIYQPMSKNINYSPLYPDPAKMYAYTAHPK